MKHTPDSPTCAAHNIRILLEAVRHMMKANPSDDIAGALYIHALEQIFGHTIKVETTLFQMCLNGWEDVLNDDSTVPAYFIQCVVISNSLRKSKQL